MSGFVSFVSAGPGDPDLLTMKGAARLREADVVLYDDLASGAILDLARSGETEALLSGLQQRHGGELMRFEIALAEPLGRYRAWKAARPIVQWSVIR